MRVFFATGEASGDMLAAALAGAMRARVPALEASGIGSERMAAAGIELVARTEGWASLGPLEAIARIAPLLLTGVRNAFALLRHPRDLVVLVDFGAFNLRFAEALRNLGYRRPILYYFPPGAWFDKPEQARKVARVATPLVPFTHQRDFYRGLGLPVAYEGHPLVSLIEPRPPRAPAPPDGGRVAILPGSRRGEIERHLQRLLAAAECLRATRPRLEVVVSTADAFAAQVVDAQLRSAGLSATLVRGARAALDDADAAWIASGTAVLEAALREVPAVALYVVSSAQVPIAKRIWKRPFITLPNILLDRPAVPELLQDDATPEALASALDVLLRDPAGQLQAVRELRALLGPPDALERAAAFAVETAST